MWEDQFKGEQINKRNWSLEVNRWEEGISCEQQCYTDDPNNAFVKDGLHIVALKQSHTGPDNAEGAIGGYN
ncbi:hypothetical protein OH492_08075 [Vibrio chagasii]|nr:hypothetical protein [Vibrio chagasii]